MDQSVSTTSIESHYTHGSLLEAIDSALETAGRSPENLTIEDLAPVDEFHIRGREATRELLRALSLPENPAVLDVGCGIGGTARYLAAEYEAQVLGVDISSEYCDVARELTRRVELDHLVSVRQGSVLDLPVTSNRFDLVVSEHVQMNVAEKETSARKMVRALRPGGHLVLYEIFSGQGDAHYPVPWADDPSISFLVSTKHMRAVIQNAGAEIKHWEDRTMEAREWFERTLAKVREEGPPPVGLHLLMGETAMEKMQNVLRNLEEGRIEIASTVARKPSEGGR